MQAPTDIPGIPSLLKQCGACMVLENASTDAMSWANENQGDWLASSASPGRSRFVELLLGIWKDNKVHFHIERSEDDLADETTQDCDFDEIVRKITRFSQLANDQPLRVITRGRLTVPLADLPQHGLIARAVGASGKSCGTEIALVGGQIEVQDELCTSIDFKKTRDRTGVNLSVDFMSQEVMAPDFFENLDATLLVVLDCFVFGRVEAEAPHAG